MRQPDACRRCWARVVASLAVPVGLAACSPPASINWYVVYESRAVGTVRHQLDGEVETWEVGAYGDGAPCTFGHEIRAELGPFAVSCEPFFGFGENTGELMLDSDQEIFDAYTRVGEAVAPMTAELTITESVGEIDYKMHRVPADYLRRYTVSGELDCEAAPELGCEGIWSFDLVGEQTKADVVFHTGDPF